LLFQSLIAQVLLDKTPHAWSLFAQVLIVQVLVFQVLVRASVASAKAGKHKVIVTFGKTEAAVKLRCVSAAAAWPVLGPTCAAIAPRGPPAGAVAIRYSICKEVAHDGADRATQGC
jgi:hypothetical protein